MNIKLRNVLLGLTILLVVGSMSPFVLTVRAEEEEETLGQELQRDIKWLYDKGKEKGAQFGSWASEKIPEAAESVKENAPKIAEDIKEKAPEVYEGTKDAIKSGVSQASEAISDYRAGQQEEFMDWFENQTSPGGAANISEEISESEATEIDAEEPAELEVEPEVKPDEIVIEDVLSEDTTEDPEAPIEATEEVNTFDDSDETSTPPLPPEPQTDSKTEAISFIGRVLVLPVIGLMIIFDIFLGLLVLNDFLQKHRSKKSE